MTTKPIPPETPLDDLHPSRFLKPSDLLERWRVQEITVEIASLQWETTIPNPRDIDPATNKPREITQPVLYFRTRTGNIFPRGYLVSSKTDTAALKSATSATTVGQTIGKRITITLQEHKGRAVLRIAPKPPS